MNVDDTLSFLQIAIPQQWLRITRKTYKTMKLLLLNLVMLYYELPLFASSYVLPIN